MGALLRSSRALIALLVLGCSSGAPPAPTVAEPADNSVSDRALIRARMSPPIDDYTFGISDDTSGACGQGGQAVCGGHAAWRLDGGPIVDVDHPATTPRDPKTPFLFAVTLAAGVNHLEIGRCDSFEYCGWTPRTVTVTPRSGSPDPAFAHTGQLLLPQYAYAASPTPLTDGSLVVAVLSPALGAQIVHVGTDGAVDPAFGDRGAIAVPATDLRIFPLDGGKLLVFDTDSGGPQILRYSSDGKLDASFGAAGVAPIATPTRRRRSRATGRSTSVRSIRRCTLSTRRGICAGPRPPTV